MFLLTYVERTFGKVSRNLYYVGGFSKFYVCIFRNTGGMSKFKRRFSRKYFVNFCIIDQIITKRQTFVFRTQ